jgi:hypothetical protein
MLVSCTKIISSKMTVPQQQQQQQQQEKTEELLNPCKQAVPNQRALCHSRARARPQGAKCWCSHPSTLRTAAYSQMSPLTLRRYFEVQVTALLSNAMIMAFALKVLPLWMISQAGQSMHSWQFQQWVMLTRVARRL